MIDAKVIRMFADAVNPELLPTASDTQQALDAQVHLGIPCQNHADLIAFLKTFTDDRVRYQKAPFDHPGLVVIMGHKGNHLAATPGNPLHPDLAEDETLTVEAIGKNGSTTPIRPFVEGLAP